MSTSTTAPVPTDAGTRRTVLARVSLATGLVAAVLTMVLSLLAVAAGAVAVATGSTVLARRGPGRAAAAGVALGASTIYLVLLEVVVLGA